MNYLNLSSLLLAVIALAVSIATYLLNRKLPNENKIFDEKIRCYHALIKVMNDTVVVIFSAIREYDALKVERARDIDEQADELNDDIDDAFNALEDVIAENTLVLPGVILDQLYLFLDLINKEEYLDTYRRPKQMAKLQATVNEAFDRLVVAMQEDLGFEKLDSSLKHRTGGKRTVASLGDDEN